MSNEEKRIEWEAHIKACWASGETVPRWCAIHHINRRQMYYWMRKLNARRTTFLPVQFMGEAEPESLALESVSPGLPNGLRIRIGTVVIEVDAGFEPGLLREVVRALEVDPVC